MDTLQPPSIDNLINQMEEEDDNQILVTDKRIGSEVIAEPKPIGVRKVKCYQLKQSRVILKAKPKQDINALKDKLLRLQIHRMDSDEEMEDAKQQPEKVKQIRTVFRLSVLPDSSPALPDSYKEAIETKLGGFASNSAVLVMQRQIRSSDTISYLAIPGERMKTKVLVESEYEKLRGFYGFMEVRLVEPCLGVSGGHRLEQACGAWCFEPLEYNYRLGGVCSWKDVVNRNSLKAGMNVQLWSFRLTSSNHPCFGLVLL